MAPSSARAARSTLSRSPRPRGQRREDGGGREADRRGRELPRPTSRPRGDWRCRMPRCRNLSVYRLVVLHVLEYSTKTVVPYYRYCTVQRTKNTDAGSLFELTIRCFSTPPCTVQRMRFSHTECTSSRAAAAMATRRVRLSRDCAARRLGRRCLDDTPLAAATGSRGGRPR